MSGIGPLFQGDVAAGATSSSGLFSDENHRLAAKVPPSTPESWPASDTMAPPLPPWPPIEASTSPPPPVEAPPEPDVDPPMPTVDPPMPPPPALDVPAVPPPAVDGSEPHAERQAMTPSAAAPCRPTL